MQVFLIFFSIFLYIFEIIHNKKNLKKITVYRYMEKYVYSIIITHVQKDILKNITMFIS